MTVSAYIPIPNFCQIKCNSYFRWCLQQLWRVTWLYMTNVPAEKHSADSWCQGACEVWWWVLFELHAAEHLCTDPVSPVREDGNIKNLFKIRRKLKLIIWAAVESWKLYYTNYTILHSSNALFYMATSHWCLSWSKQITVGFILLQTLNVCTNQWFLMIHLIFV